MNGLFGWLLVVGVVLLLNRVLGGLVNAGRMDGGATPGPGGGSVAGPGRESRPSAGEGAGPAPAGRGRLSDPRLDPGFLRDLAVLAERQARARSGPPPGSAPLGVALPDASAPPKASAADRTGLGTPGRGGEPSRPAVPGRGLGASVGAGTREIGVGRKGSSAPRARAAGSAAGGLPEWPGRTALQRAVLYEAILGRPLALRGEGGAPEGAPAAG